MGLIAFENVKASEPANYISHFFARDGHLPDRRVQRGLRVRSAWPDRGGARSPRGLLGVGLRRLLQREEGPEPARLRENEEEFKELINRYDEPIFNENILKGIKNLFGGNK